MPEPTVPHRWSNTTKLVVGLSFAALLVMLAVKFQYLLSPIIISIVLAYIFQPLVAFLSKKLRISKRVAVVIVYLVFVLIILGLLIWGGIALVTQLTSLVNYLSKNISTLSASISTFFANPIKIGTTVINLNTIDLTQFNDQLIQYAQQGLAGLGTVIANVGKSALSIVGWTLFSILISYFILSESEKGSGRLLNLNFLDQSGDQQKIGAELDRIWNAYLRRQFLIFLLTVLIYTIILSLLRVNFFFGLALIAGLARFIPYIGPLITWITFALVAGFSSTPILGLSPLGYAILVVVICYLVDAFMDAFITTKMMASALNVHPAAVMVATLVGLNLFGVIGVILAAPILATLILIFDYAKYKMIDQDPWEHIKLLPRERKNPAWVIFLTNLVKKCGMAIKSLFTRKSAQKPNTEIKLKTKKRRIK